jgi:hypothetical protein
MEASWKIRPKATEEEILSTLERVIRFVRSQNQQDAVAISELERDLGVPVTTAATSSTTPTATAASPSAAAGTGGLDSAPRVQMMPPGSLSDRPSDGGPTQDNFGWGSMPTTTVPAHLQQAWEIIPPGEA